MTRIRPGNGLHVATRDNEQSLADGRGAELARPHFPPLDRVSQVLKLLHPPPERLPLALLAGLAAHQRSPCLELLDVLQHDDARLDDSRPAQRDPSETADLLLHRLAALGLREVLAVGREPGETDLPAGDHRRDVHLPDVLAEVERMRVIRRVHRKGFRIVVDGDVYRATERQLYPRAGAAPAGEVIDDQFVGCDSRYDSRVIRHPIPPRATHGRTASPCRAPSCPPCRPRTPSKARLRR